MASTIVEEPQTKRAGKGQKQGNEGVEDVSMSLPNPLEELRKQAEAAYTSYLGAQRKVAKAYRQREQQEVSNYKLTEQQANKDCDDAIQQALAARTRTEKAARDAYEKAMEEASKDYDQKVTEALKSCRQAIENQWQIANELSEQIWTIFQGDGTK